MIWYAARAGGVLAYVLLSASAVLGMVLARKRTPPWPKFAVEEVHRFLTILTGVFLAIHVGALLADSYTPFSLGQVLVPFASSYRPFGTALGIVALELLVAVALTNLVRRRIPRRLWRRAYFLTFGVWGAATLHGVPLRKDGWVVVHNVLRDDVGGNVDHFVSSPTRKAFAIETKSGRLRAADRGQAISNAIWAKDKFGVRFVTAVICVGTDRPVEPTLVKHGNATV